MKYTMKNAKYNTDCTNTGMNASSRKYRLKKNNGISLGKLQ